jgi:cytochrome c oxidase subunit 2
VIHSFWVPNLAGKLDLIPARTNYLWLQADRPGVYRGQCAEYCGAQHAHMGLEVIAEPAEQFSRWLEAQMQPGVAPSNDKQLRGQQVFLSSPCVMCHAVRGTKALAQAGPDLTHVGGRQSLASATLRNNRGSLGGWITNAQGIKPGNHMPRISLPPQDLDDLIAYLEALK